MEPNLVTDPKILNILNELIQREPIFHRPELGTTRADFEQMTESTFWEVGASGRRYSREYVLDEMEKLMPAQRKTHGRLATFIALRLPPKTTL